MSFSPYICIQTNSTCYKQTKSMNVLGILWHSTGANNPNLKRYVQPLKTDTNYKEAINKLGKNAGGNDWNHVSNNAGVNAFIGKFADGTVGTVQAMPWNYRPWGCGSGTKGSCNDGWIQFEICEDNLKDKAYAQKVWDEAIALTAYLCKKYNLDPNGTVKKNGVNIPVITCHSDACKLGFGSNHADINHWFPKILGKNMSNARAEVAALLKPKEEVKETSPSYPTVPFVIGVTTSVDVKKTAGGATIGAITKGTYTITEVSGNWGKLKSGVGWVDLQTVTIGNSSKAFVPYIVQVTKKIKIYEGAGTSYKVMGSIAQGGKYTIVEEKNGWGLLKAYQKNKNGWIQLSATKKV